MNQFHCSIASILVFVLIGTAHAQDDSAWEDWADIQSSFHPWMADAFEDPETLYQEANRVAALFIGDITMTMRTFDGGTGHTGGSPEGDRQELEEIVIPDVLEYEQNETESSVHAQLDWENLAMSMRVKSDQQSTLVRSIFGFYENIQQETNLTMYFDASGNVYVPYTNEDGSAPWADEIEGDTYMVANLGDLVTGMFGALEFGLEAIIDSRIRETLDHAMPLLLLAVQRSGRADEFDFHVGNDGWYLLPGWDEIMADGYYDQVYYDEDRGQWLIRDQTRGVLENRLRNALGDIVRARHAALAPFPLISFAFIYSPTLIRTHGDSFREDPTTWRNQDGATKFTITSESDDGYIFIFDHWDRLVFLKDTDGSTAEYRYDRDVTVQLPTTILSVQDLIRLNTP